MTDPHPGWYATKPPRHDTLIGQAIRSWCRTTGVSQARLAETLDVDHSYINRLASGEREPSRDFAIRLGEAIGITAEDVALAIHGIDPAAYRAGIVQAERRTLLQGIYEGVADDDAWRSVIPEREDA